MKGLREQLGRWSEGLRTRRQIAALRSRERLYFETVLRLLRRIEEFVVPNNELQSREFIDELNALREQIVRHREQSKSLSPDTGSEFIHDYAVRQLDYLKSTEQELRGIIEVLSEGLKTIGNCNADFHQKMASHLERLGSISELTDLRQLRGRLQDEIRSVRESLVEVTERQAEQMQALSGQVHVLREKLERAEHEARSDSLTGVLNRRALDPILQSRLVEFEDGGANFAVVMMDLDEFKQVNDRFGHAIGDRALLAVVENCRGLIRRNDIFARYGGDEFVFVFPESSARNAAKIARKICETLTATRFELEKAIDGTTHLVLSASFGVTECRKGDSAVTLLERADHALYQAKNEGRRRVVVV